MPLMGSFYVGTSGLQMSQNALNTTAHNISNKDTQGFVRQQVLQADRVYNTIKNGTPATGSMQTGLGVTYAKVRQVRDYFLDQSYRKENGRAAFYSTSFNALTEVEDLLDEYNDDASFNHALTKLWSSIEELAKTPDDTVVQRLLIQNAQTFLTNAKQVYAGLVDYQNELNSQIKDKVAEINSLGHQILDLNAEIRKVETGIEAANDLRDARNEALDKLSSMVTIKYEEDIYGAITVEVEGYDFVGPDKVYEMNAYLDSQTGFYTPFWENNATYTYDAEGDKVWDISEAKVFDTYRLISSEKGTDIGELRAMLYARGDRVANFTDIPVKPVQPDFTDTVKYPYGTNDPQYALDAAEYNYQMGIYEEEVDVYNHTIAQSVCMNIQAEFDQLVHNVAVSVNEVLYGAFQKNGGEYMVDDDGSPLQIFQKIATPGFTKNEVTGEWEYYPENTSDHYYVDTLYTINNLQINPTLVREAGKMGFILKDGTVDFDTAYGLLEAFDKDQYVLNPNVTTTCSINTYYTNLVSQVANSGFVYKSIAESQAATVASIQSSREQVVGVSADEELTNMIKFQNAFNAASRYINVVDEMLEHIITSM
jgi:flagellar hook-associated protein 1 FlgK